MSKFISIEEAVKLIPDGASVMFGGFMGCGNAHKFIDALSKSGVKDLTMICNDGSMPGGFMGEDYYGVAKLIHNKQIKKLIATHVGLNPEVGIQSFDGSLETILVPQGSFVEMIRASGAGLGGVLTPTGVGTIIEDSPLCLGKQTINGRDYLLMAPIHADVALLGTYKCDESGNCWYKGTMRNFNPVMATAADLVIAETEYVVPVGEIEPENIHTYGICVDYIVEGEKK